MERTNLGIGVELCRYVDDHNRVEHEALARLRAATAGLANAQMQISASQGYLLQFLVRLTGASRALEVGTFTGYSALAVALALPETGKLVACEISPDYPLIGRPFWEQAGVAHKIDLRVAPAMQTLDSISALDGESAFDFAFIDADKQSYDAYYEACLRLVRQGGVIVLDNMLRRGRVVNPSPTDLDSALVSALNRKIAEDDRVYSVLLAVGDGMTLVLKR